MKSGWGAILTTRHGCAHTSEHDANLSATFLDTQKVESNHHVLRAFLQKIGIVPTGITPLAASLWRTKVPLPSSHEWMRFSQKAISQDEISLDPFWGMKIAEVQRCWFPQQMHIKRLRSTDSILSIIRSGGGDVGDQAAKKNGMNSGKGGGENMSKEIGEDRLFRITVSEGEQEKMFPQFTVCRKKDMYPINQCYFDIDEWMTLKILHRSSGVSCSRVLFPKVSLRVQGLRRFSCRYYPLLRASPSLSRCRLRNLVAVQSHRGNIVQDVPN